MHGDEDFLNSIPAALFRVDLQGAFLFVNEYFCRLTGYDRDDLIGQNWTQLVNSNERSAILKSWLQETADEQNFIEICNIEYKSQRLVWCEVKAAPARDQEGKVYSYLATLTDIRTWKHLEKIDENYFEKSPDLLSIVGFDGYPRRLNYAWQRILEFSIEELSSQPFYEILHPEDRDLGIEKFQEIVKGKNIDDFEMRAISKQGQVKWLEWSGVLSNEEPLVYIRAHDITKQKYSLLAAELQHDLAVKLKKYQDLESTSCEILQIICERLGWDLGIFWVKDPAINQVRFADYWCRQTNPLHHTFVDVSKPYTFSLGESYIGKAWKEQKMLWVSRIKSDPFFLRAPFALQARFQSLFLLPIIAKNEVLGIAEFYSQQVEKEDQTLFPIIKSISTQIGEFVTHQEMDKKAQLLSSIVESSESAIIGKNLEGLIVSWNQSATKLYLYQSDEVIGKSVLMLYPENRKEEFTSLEERVLKGERIDNYETTRLQKGGQEIHVSLSISPIYDASGKVIGISTITRDITKQKQIENELNRVNLLHRAILDSSLYMFISTDPKGIIQTFSKTAEKHLGYRAEEVIGKSTPMIIHDLNEIVERGKELSQELGIPIQGFEVFIAKPRRGIPDEREWTFIHKNGSRFPVHLAVTALRDAKEEIIGYLGVIRDLREKKKLEKALRKEEKRFSTLVENSIDSIMTLDPEGQILSYNKASQGIFHYQPSEIIGKNFDLLFASPSKKEIFDYFLEAMNNQEINPSGIKKEVVCKRKEGEYFSAEISISPVSLEQTKQFICITRDIQERKQLETMKSEFVSNVSHELRTPMTSISGSLGLILSGRVGSLNPEVKKLLEIAFRNSERLGRLINDILDLDKMEMDKMVFHMEKLDLVSILQNVVELSKAYADKMHVSLVLEQPFSYLLVRADSDRLTQVLINLISNAIKFSPSSPAVDDPQQAVVTIRTERVDGRVRVSVTDRGQGIPTEFQHRIFQKFAQLDSADNRKLGGTGLGLCISKNIIEKMQGAIGFTSAPGKGTTFYIELNEVNPHVPTSQAAKILICEDDLDAAQVLEMIFQAHGFSTAISYSAEEAMELLQKDTFCLLSIDDGLPGETGLAFLEDLRKQTAISSIPVLVISGKISQQSEMMQKERFPIIGWLGKPIDARSVTSVLKNHAELLEQS